MTTILNKTTEEIVLPQEKLEYLQRELTNVRHELTDNKYILEARRVLQAGGLRSAIGSYWNAVSDDLRRKVIHRSLDLFNKEMNKNVKTYEDFQTHVTDNDLIEGAYKIGALSWEAKKIMHQARETRNIYDGHPDSSDPSLFKVLNMIADCNQYVLSQEYPIPIINVNDYLLKMDTDTYDKHELAVEQAFIDLPELYKGEMCNKLFTYYTSDTISTRFRSNIEFSFPILWKVSPREIRQQIGQRFDKTYLEGDAPKNQKSVELLSLVDGLRYTSTTTRRLIYEPKIKFLEDNLDDWNEEAKVVKILESYGSVVPEEYIGRLVSALTLTFVGYKGNSYRFNRTAFYSNAAAPRISRMFENFDNKSAEEFVGVIKKNNTLKSRISGTEQLRRLRTLGDILLNKPEIKDETKKFLELLVDETKTKELYQEISKR
ncbi:hypothetical protein [Sphingobacterium wenxiniae]|uniref:Uncharacterized protein n=1 Tax=Sphingobacterium wenxiniae TaxID=683125 RepID=A0A1I6THI7_9SPHI|nr:hypothetical protein [Sphingobacterium wenxiniae]SFS88635.1 hypothetical protein SAMN05660206_106153 [Sphingobacterium wenxiniae]